MLQGSLEGVALTLVDISVSAWQCQMVVLQKITKDACIVGGLFSRLVLSYDLIASLSK